jgi:uncharacterized protein YbjT (DUF2867 family)
MTTLVLGATGKTGRRICDRLGDANVRRGSRATGFDWDDRSTWPALVDGVDAAYIAYYPDLSVPGAAETVGAFSALAASHGVRRLVLLSGRGEPEARRAERAMAATGTEWTVLRCAWFAQNFSEDFMADGVLAGELALPAGAIPEPFVDAEDIADVAVAALTRDGHHGQVYELTGPRALRFEEAVAEIAAASGRDVRFTEIGLDEFVDAAPPDFAELGAFLFGELLDGRNAEPQDGVQRALGRAPRDFGEFARRAAGDGVWARTGVEI